MNHQPGQNNFALLPEYQQHNICRATLALVNRIRLNNPTLWARIQAEAAMDEMNKAYAIAQAQGVPNDLS